MARGGARQGAGRKAGAATRRTREVANKAAEQGITPLEYMLAVMRDKEIDPLRRDSMAKAAAPYLHAALKAIELTGKGGGPVIIAMDDADRRA